MENLTIYDIQQMSNEEVAEMNKKLMKTLVKRMGLTIGLKWIVIAGVAYGTRKWIESLPDKTEETK